MEMDEKAVADLVVRHLQERGDMDGYALMQGISVSLQQLRPAIEQLVSLGKLRYRGNLQGQGLAEAWYTVRQSSNPSSSSYSR